VDYLARVKGVDIRLLHLGGRLGPQAPLGAIKIRPDIDRNIRLLANIKILNISRTWL
jgi:hypothetical protein